MERIIKFSLFFFGLFLFAPSVYAARLYFEPSQNIHPVGETFTVSLRLDTQGESINAIDLGILYPPLLEIQGISKSGSLVQLWVQEPNFTSTGMFFAGGVPGGIKTASGLVAKITVRAKAIGDGTFQVSPASAVLLNDGQGTRASLVTGQVAFSIITQPKKEPTPTPKESDKAASSAGPKVSLQASPRVEEPKNLEESKGEESKDTSKPKKFEIFIGQDPHVFDGKNFVSFFTTDSKTGVDRYEIREGDGKFKIAQSPYLLSDQELDTVIRVRAYDTAGNYRETTYPGKLKRLWWWITKFFGK